MRILLALLSLLWACALSQAQSVSAAPSTSILVCAYNSTLPTVATGNFAYVQCDSSGKLLTSNTPALRGQSHLPFILPSSGSMGNNGALTITTALPATYPNAYISLPAGAIATGVPAAQAWYYATCSSTTACTVFNNTYTSGNPTIPASPTAFATTGPGAYTQTTGSGIAAWNITIAGGDLGTNSCIQVTGAESHPNTAGSKSIVGAYSTYNFGTVTNTTTAEASFYGGVCNRGRVDRQGPFNSYGGFGALTNTVAANFGSIDSTADQTLKITFQLTAATDYQVLENVVATLIPGVP